MKIAPSQKQKLKAVFSDLHPRYPAGDPRGGQFMPKGSTDYNNAIATKSKPEWEQVTGKDFRKHFGQWEQSAKQIFSHLENFDKVDEARNAIAAHQDRIAKDKKAIAGFDPQSDEGRQNIKLRQDAIDYRQQEITRHQQYLDSTPKASKERLEDSRMLYNIFTENMQGRALIGVKDGDEMGAAAAIIPKKDHIYIDFLMTNPKSLIDGKSKGAGTAAIKAVAKRSMESGKNGVIKLWAVNSAVPFYEKVGFTRDDPNGNYMTLSSEAAKKLLGVSHVRR